MPDGTIMTGKKHKKNSKDVTKLKSAYMNQKKVKLDKKDLKEEKRNKLKKEVKKKAKPKKKARKY